MIDKSLPFNSIKQRMKKHIVKSCAEAMCRLELADKMDAAMDFALEAVDLFRGFEVPDIATAGDMLAWWRTTITRWNAPTKRFS